VTDVDTLYAVPLEEFVAERKRVAKELRAAGDRDAAAEVAKLPKPTPPAWALNRFAREQADVVEQWLDVAAALRAASADPGPELRTAMAAHREATTGLLAAVRDQARPNGRPLTDAMLERVRALLQVALTDPEQGERLRAGRIVEGTDADAPLMPEPSSGGSRATAKPEAETKGKSPAQERKERERAERIAELERRIQDARDQLERREKTAAARDEAAAAAGEHLEEARRTLHRSESEASAADDAAHEARAAAREAERELKTLTAKLRKAGGETPS
jgi:hypothetical protein